MIYLLPIRLMVSIAADTENPNTLTHRTPCQNKPLRIRRKQSFSKLSLHHKYEAKFHSELQRILTLDILDQSMKK